MCVVVKSPERAPAPPPFVTVPSTNLSLNYNTMNKLMRGFKNAILQLKVENPQRLCVSIKQ